MVYNQPGIDNPDHDHTLKYRNKTMGASSVASLLGFSHFSSPEDLCMTYQLEMGNTFKANVAIDFGNELEDYILRKAQELIPEKYPHLFGQDHSWIDGKGAEFRSTKFEHLTCNFDGILRFDETGVCVPVEAKCSDAYIKNGTFYTVSDYLYTQMQIQMYVLDSPFGFGIQLDTEKKEFKIEYVPRDDEFINTALSKVSLFFESNYDINNDYAWFNKDQLEHLFDEDLEKLDKMIKEETKLKRAHEDKKAEVDEKLKELDGCEFKSAYYTQKENIKKTYKINNQTELFKKLIDDEIMNVDMKVPFTKLQKNYPDLFEEYVEVIETKEFNGRRNTKGITK